MTPSTSPKRKTSGAKSKVKTLPDTTQNQNLSSVPKTAQITNYMKKFLQWSSGFLSNNGEASSKRFVGVVSSMFLCWTMYSNSRSAESIKPADSLVYSVAALAFGCLGLTTTEAIFKKNTVINPKEDKLS